MRPNHTGTREAARSRSGTAWLAPAAATLGGLEIVASEQLGPLPATKMEARHADR